MVGQVYNTQMRKDINKRNVPKTQMKKKETIKTNKQAVTGFCGLSVIHIKR